MGNADGVSQLGGYAGLEAVSMGTYEAKTLIKSPVKWDSAFTYEMLRMVNKTPGPRASTAIFKVGTLTVPTRYLRCKC